MRRRLMLYVFMFSGQICPKARWRVVSVAIVPHGHFVLDGNAVYPAEWREVLDGQFMV